MCEYSKFWIESNSYFTIRFDSKWAQLFEIFEYLPSPISYLFNGMTPIFHLSNKAVIRFLVNWLPLKLPITGCTFQLRLWIYRVKHACVHARRVFDLSRRSYQRQMPPSSHSAVLHQPVPHLCSGRGRGGDGTDAKRIRAPSPADRERNRVSMALTLIT